MLENDFVGFPQSNLNEFYVKYDFDVNELPSDEYDAEKSQDAEQEELQLVTQEDIELFEENFKEVKEYIREIISCELRINDLYKQKTANPYL